MVSKTGRRQAVRALAHIHKYFHQTIYRFLYNTLRRIEIQSIRSRVGTVSIIALLFWSASIIKLSTERWAHRGSHHDVRILSPVGIYAWWFMHSHGGKALYGIDDDS